MSLGDRLMSAETEAGLGWKEGRKEILEYGRRLLCGNLNWKRSSQSDVLVHLNFYSARFSAVLASEPPVTEVGDTELFGS